MSEENDESKPPPPSLTPPSPTPKVPEVRNDLPQKDDAKLDIKGAPEVPEESAEPGALAPLNSRLLGGVIDVLVGMSIYLVVEFVMPDFMGKMAWVATAAYWVARDSLPFLKGQSIGKMAMKTRVVKLDGSEMIGDWRTAAIRNAALLIPIFGLVEAIILVTRDTKPERGQRLGDEWAKTKVVNAESGVGDENA